MASKADQRLEGLKELAAMIAAAYRRQIAGEGLFNQANGRYQKDSGSEDDIEVLIQLKDPEYGGLYTETVRVENFLRNRHHSRLINGSDGRDNPGLSTDKGLTNIGGPR